MADLIDLLEQRKGSNYTQKNVDSVSVLAV
jgi:hypothetical protein